MKVQVIGLPGAGKTTGISKFYWERCPSWDWPLFLDVRDIGYPLLHISIVSTPQSLIAESACGVQAASYVLSLSPPMHIVYDQLMQRDGELDENYISQLASNMPSADRTITSSDDLADALEAIFSNSFGPQRFTYRATT